MQLRSLLAGSAMLALLAGCASGQTDQQGADSPAMSASQATYQGTLPCRNCDGIDLNVSLEGEETSAPQERTFDLTASYRNHPQTPPDENYSGNWEVLNGTPSDSNATVYELTPNGDGQIYYFLKISDSTLELIDPERRRFENGEMLRLQRR
ncbi:copper resistance protein NlpE N-terminal domain-containing protein [Halomonas sp. HNIBRBA4712]|uniref:copper resistance protein NlpE N-terminal domain-containing protein n=1 Tax=Halomonas sp. HNIBRBA4712 TaxID=3373087 RepID=UPI003745DC06